MQPKFKKLLWDIDEACSDISRLTDAASFEDYLAQKDLRRLIERYLEIVGEALRQLEHVEPSLSTLIPEFRKWVNSRNVVAHGYDSVDDRIIWGTCRSAVPLLKADVRRLLDG